jgi:tetratricopeptide (TPR) repeat protein
MAVQPCRLRGCLATAAVVAGLLSAQITAAQGLALKRTVPAENTGPCPTPAPVAEMSPQQQAEANQLLSAANQAALLGDQRGAREYYRQVAALNPGDADVAYRLARIHEELGEREAAALEYCRFIYLAPDGPDAPEVRERITELLPPAGAGPQQAAQSFRAGVAYFDQGRLREAQQAFSRALRHAPGWVELYFNRALVYEAQAEPRNALRDLEHYLALRPSAEDAAAVREQITALRNLVPSSTPAGALTRGILVPGLGQFYTGRPVLGGLILSGAAIAVYAGFQEKEVVRTQAAVDPFGNPYTYPDTVVERPGVATGVALAAGISLLGAAEAYFHAKRASLRRSGGSRSSAAAIAVTPVLAPQGGRWRLGLRLHRTARETARTHPVPLPLGTVPD